MVEKRVSGEAEAVDGEAGEGSWKARVESPHPPRGKCHFQSEEARLHRCGALDQVTSPPRDDVRYGTVDGTIVLTDGCC